MTPSSTILPEPGATAEPRAPLLDETLASVHPLMAEAFYLAAAPQWFQPPLLAAMRNRPDGREGGIVERLARYPFVTVTLDDEAHGELYSVRPPERSRLRERWIAEDQPAFLAAHRRALAYWQANPDPDSVVQAQNLLYHRLILGDDPPSVYADWLSQLRGHFRERRFGAVSTLLGMADEVRPQLALLRPAELVEFDALVAFMRTRLAQLRGESLPPAENEADDPVTRLMDYSTRLASQSPLRPDLLRTAGCALIARGDYLGGEQQLEAALALFGATSDAAAGSGAFERGQTLLEIGDAYAGLAAAGLGAGPREKRIHGAGGLVRAFFYLIFYLPLIVYLATGLGRRVFQPTLWLYLRYMDWLVARLCLLAVRSYRQAAETWQHLGADADTAGARGKLAELYLQIGDTRGARAEFEQVLATAGDRLGEYRRAVLSTGLADSLLDHSEAGRAAELLEASLPPLQHYEDAITEARGHALLGEALALQGKPQPALEHYLRSARLYVKQERLAEATAVSEQARLLAPLETDAATSLAALERATLADQIDATVPRRVYTIRYRHPVTVVFERVSLAAMALVIFLAPVLAVRLVAGSAVIPQISFRAAPLLDPAPDYTPELSQGVEALNIAAVADPNVLLGAAALLAALYLLGATVLGVLLIRLWPLQAVQQAIVSDALRLEGDTLWTGAAVETEAQQRTPLAEASELLIANRTLWNDLIVDESASAVRGEGRALVIPAATSWYAGLLRRVQRAVLTTPRPGFVFRDSSHSLLKSKMAGLYVTTMATLALISLLSQLNHDLVFRDLLGTIYSLGDLYPYLYLGLFLPPIWWFIVQPLRQRVMIDPADRGPWYALAAGLVLGLVVLVAGRSWLTTPDIYPPLFALAMLVAALSVLARGSRLSLRERSPQAVALRVTAAAVAVAMIALLAGQIWRDARSYHALARANNLRDRGLEQDDPDVRGALFTRAVESYALTAALSERSVLGLDRREGSPLGVLAPQAEESMWHSAVYGRALMNSQIGDFEHALSDYSALEQIAPSAELYASRGLAQHKQGSGEGAATLAKSYTQSVDVTEVSAALADFNKALELDPANPRYLLWRAVAHHGVGELDAAEADYTAALAPPAEEAAARDATMLNGEERATADIGLGWIAFQRAAAGRTEVDENGLQESARQFTLATEADPRSFEAWLGLGFAEYRLDKLASAELAWRAAEGLNPDDSRILISLGTLNWRQGSKAGTCDDSKPLATRQEAEAFFRRSVDYFERAVRTPGQTDKKVAYTHRTLGQMHWLLEYCPNYDKLAELEKSVASYTEALRLDRSNAGFWQYRGRITYGLVGQLKAASRPLDAQKMLAQGLGDLLKALEIDPAGGTSATTKSWLNTYEPLVQKDGPAGIRLGLQALAQLDETTASAWFEASLAIISGSQDPLTALQNADKEAKAFLTTNAQVDGSPVQGRITALLNEARQTDPRWLFGEGLAALKAGEADEAGDLYRRGLAAVQLARQIPQVADAAVSLVAADVGQGSEPLLALFRAEQPRIEALFDPASILHKMKLGTLSIALGDYDNGAWWYNRGIPTAGMNNNVYYNQFLSPKADLQRVWQARDVESAAAGGTAAGDDGSQLAPALAAAQERLFTSTDTRRTSAWYWRNRGWFQYNLGVAAFRAGREETAAALLEVAKIDSTQGYVISNTLLSHLHTYLPEAAWAWYHVERGAVLAAQKDDAGALEQYETAFAASAPDKNSLAWAEKAEIAFRAGLTSFRLDENEQAAEWYDRGIELSAGRLENGDMKAAVQKGLDDLKQWLGEQAVPPEGGAGVVGKLSAALGG